MPREVRHDDTGPYVLTEADIDDEKGDIAVCRCGLSPAFPFCDGSHRTTHSEDPGACYRYPDGTDGERRVLATAGDATGSGPCDGSTPDAGGDSTLEGRDTSADGTVAVHEARSPRIVDPEELADAGGRLCLRLSDLAADVCGDPGSDGSGREDPGGEP